MNSSISPQKDRKTAVAAVMTGAGKDFSLREYPVTPPAAGYARLSLIASGVCGTDLHIHSGRLGVRTPAVIGHEFVGRIEALSPQSNEQGLSAGDACIVDIAVPCGRCALCLSGDDANCVNMGVTNGGNPDDPPHFHGGYAEVTYAPLANLIRIPDGVDPKTAAVFACAGPTALHAFSLAERAGVSAGAVKTAVVQGLGPVGAFAVLYLRSLGIPNIVAVTARAVEKRAETARALGATAVVSLEKDGLDGVSSLISSLSGGLGADLVYEASGKPASFAQGLTLLRNRGVYLVPGQYSNSGPVSIEPQLITFKALHILGSSQYSLCDVRAYTKLLAAHPEYAAVIGPLAAEYPLREIQRAVKDAAEGKNVKTLLVP